jgi:phosphate/phosphite/phosphonate ABC transporter binding protein
MIRKLSLFVISLFFVMACSIPSITAPQATALPSLNSQPDTPPPLLPKPELGQPENPLILALAPTPSPEQVNAAKEIANQFMERTGYTVVVVIPDSNPALLDALARGNVHIVLLNPLSYEFAYQKGLARAAYAVVQDGKATYGAQFIAAQKSGFTPYFDEETQTNTADAPVALKQFTDKKPCWSDEASSSGYVIPLGFLNRNNVLTLPAAFVQGHPTVVRSIYAGGICDFGATYIDARKFPSLEDQYPDLMEHVHVIWRIPEIIPYQALVFSTQMPPGMHDLFAGFVPAIMQTEEGGAAFKKAFDIEELLPVNDAFFDEFHKYVHEARLDLSTLLQ